jgi:hypothetical protein
MPTPRKAPITLSDLSDQDRTRLLEEARQASRRNPTDVEGYDSLSDREKGIRTLMDARDHLRDCPVQIGTLLGRVEGYDTEQPANPAIGRPRRMIAVTRCMECGGTTVFKDPPLTLEEALAGVLEPAPAAAASSPSSSAGTDDETP